MNSLMTRLVDGETEPRGVAYRPTLVIVVASTFVSMLAYAGPLGNAVTLNRAMEASPAGATWILASMSAGLAATLLVAGAVADRVGALRVFMWGAAAFVVANAVNALADATPVFVGARVVAGFGATGMIATGLSLAAAADPDGRHRSTTATGWSVAMGAGIALGPILTGLFDLMDAWRWFYGLLALVGVVLLLAARSSLTDVPRVISARRLDVVGFIILTVLLGVLVTAIVEIRASGAITALVLFAVAAVLLLALGVSQRVGTARLVDPSLFTHRPFLGATIAAFGTGLGVIAAMSFCCTVIVAGLGASTLRSAAVLAAWSGTSALAALVFVRISHRLSGAVQLVIGLLGVAVGLAALSGLSVDDRPERLLPGLIVTGIATGLLNAGLARQAIGTVPPDATAMGAGANNTARYLGSTIGVSVASVIATGGGIVGGWNLVAWLTAAVSAVCAVLVALLSRVSRGDGSVRADPVRADASTR